MTDRSLTLVCRTDVASAVTLRHGRYPGPPWDSEASTPAGTQHVFALSGLRPETRYVYELVSGVTVLARGERYTFETAPPQQSRAPFRFLAFGDSGTGSSTQLAVAARMEEVLPVPDFALGLGDLVYNDGAWADYDPKLFTPYARLFPQMAFWPTLGNHDTSTENGAPYFDAFYLPTTTGAPGRPSNTEHYYSFDHGMAHFTCVDSEDSSSSPGGTMYRWVEDDLADARARGKRWLIVFMHHPPYTRGTHNSDSESSLITLRENLVPLFEAQGVDLVATGHSHNYERSFLARNDAVLQSDPDDYTKIGTPNGTIYLVSGCAGKTGSGALDHPLMARAYGGVAGFSLLDVSWEELRGTFVESDGQTTDLFTLHKASDVVPPRIATLAVRAVDELALVFDEPVEAGTGASGSENLGRYALQSGAVLDATLQSDQRTVLLGTASLQTNRAYALSAQGVADTSGNDSANLGGWFVRPDPAPAPPLAVLSTEVHTANLPARITFSSARSTDASGPLSAVRWDFGDGSPVVSGTTVEHLYDRAGLFMVHLIVTDAAGFESVARQLVRIHAQGDAPLAFAAANPLDPQTGASVAFASSASQDPDGGALFLSWDFGDPASGAANRSQLAAPTHVYASAGTYTAVLTVADDEGSAATAKVVVTVGGSSQDTIPPQVTSRSPLPDATSVPRSTNVTASFNEPVQGVSATTFTLKQGAATLAAQVSYDPATRTAVLDPTVELALGTSFTVNLTSGIRDLATVPIALAPISWTFTTGAPSPSNVTFLATADAMVKSTNLTTNYGSDPSLRLRSGSPEYQSHLRFQVSGVTSGISSAKLRLYVTDGSNDGGAVYAVAAEWSEGTINWSNAPSMGASPLATAATVTANSWVEYDVTAHVTGDGSVAFALRSASEDSAMFSSREGAHPPELVLQTDAESPVFGPPPSWVKEESLTPLR
jgi:PKD repeat protein